MSTITVDVVYPHSQQKVWQALTDSRALADWLMPNDFAPKVGHKFQFRSDPQPGWDGIVRCEVLEVDEPRRLSYSWRGGTLDTVVTFELAPHGENTRLIMRQAGFSGFKAELVRLIMKNGWGGMYKRKLPVVLGGIGADGVYRPAAGPAKCGEARGWKVLVKLFAPFLSGKPKSQKSML